MATVVSSPLSTPLVTAPEPVAAGSRMLSLDVLRGFDMFWIIGGDAIARSLKKISADGWFGSFAEQFEHVSWEGFRFYDLIFPLFLFIIGVSLVFSLGKIVAKEGMRSAHARILRRGLLLFLLGVFYDEGFAKFYDAEMALDENLLCGVLQRLALCYVITSLLFIHLRLRGLIVTFGLLLVGYWALLSFVPPPGLDHPTFEKGLNWAHYVDLHTPPYYSRDPEGYLSTLPAVGTCLLGVFSAMFLKDSKREPKQKALVFMGVGVALVILGYLWGLQFPVIKRIWTSSYVVLAGGYSVFLLGLFYLVIDVWKYRKWATPFVWIGMNPLTIYLATNMVDFEGLASRLVGGPVAGSIRPFGDLLITAVSLGMAILLVRFLYKKQIFLRV
jgi:predicted acyltransferase